MATVRLIRNIGLGDAATSTQTSTVDEPTAAASGDNIFVTGNWFASQSTDGGATWSLVNPFTRFPPAAGGFCCDQSFGGGSRHPAHVVGFRDGAEWRLAVTRAGTDGPPGGAWGDYLSCRRYAPGSSEWVASGFTLQGGADRRDVEPQYVHFGSG